MGLCALVITVAAYQMSSGARSDGSRPVRLYESMRRMSPYPLEPPYAPSSFVRSAPLQPHEVLERPHPSTCEALRRHLRSALPRRATAADGTARRAAILEICACGDSFTPRSSRAMDVRRIHLTEASLAQHASSLRGGRGDELAADFAQDVSGGDNNGFLLPFADCTFDAVVLSFCAPTLSRPFELLAEVNRVLAQDAPAIVALGGPLPKGRAGAMWDGMPDETQLYVIGSYFHYTDVATDGWYEDLSVQQVAAQPPLLLMTARRLGGAAYMWRRLENDRAYRNEEEEDRRLDRPRGANRAPLFTALGGVAERWLGGESLGLGLDEGQPGARAAKPPVPTAAPAPPAPAQAGVPAAAGGRSPEPLSDSGMRAPVGSAQAQEHARAVRAAAAAASDMTVRPRQASGAGVSRAAANASANVSASASAAAVAGAASAATGSHDGNGAGTSSASGTINGGSRQRILDVIQAGVERALERAEARTEKGGEALTQAEAEVLARLRKDLRSEGGSGTGENGLLS